MIERKRVKRTRGGRFLIRIPVEERDVLRHLPGQLQELLATDDPSLRRLFPPAYLDDEEKEAEYQGLMREDLLARHQAALAILAETIDADEVDEEQLTAWMAALNELRLVLGTRLDVTEDFEDGLDPDDPLAPAFGLYIYLGWLQEQVVAALANW
ncbi:MAG: hypothetical protein QOG64_1111 [Acidimicrobiaceae bacterium]|nr:hypothetical protein [Acidimicrobiaceae bacterium]